MSFNPSKSLVTTRQAIINGKVRNLTKTTGIELAYAKKDGGDYVIIDQEEADVLFPDGVDREGHTFKRTYIWVFKTFKDMEKHIREGYYKNERFFVNLFVRGSNEWAAVKNAVYQQERQKYGRY